MMCGLSKEDQAKSLYKFITHHLIKIEKNKVIVKDIEELYKQSLFYRKLLARSMAR